MKKETNEWYLSPHKYFAFISYSHQDIDYARQMQKSLESYDITTIIESKKACHMTPICRDETDFASGSLNNTIKTKLAQSKKLIVLCSKSAKNSAYVAQEVDFFIDTFGIENVIPVLVETFENIDDILPGKLALCTGTESELLCIDRFGFDHQDDKKVILQLIASILDIDYDTVYNRNQKRTKNLLIKRTATAIGVILAILIVALFGLRSVASVQIEKNLQTAQDVRKTDISAAISTLQEAKTLSRRWFIKNDNIHILMNDILNYSQGACLKVTDIASADINNEASYTTNHENTFLVSDYQAGSRYSIITDYTSGKTLAAIYFSDASIRYIAASGSMETVKFNCADDTIKNSFSISFKDDVIAMLLAENTADDYSLKSQSVAAVNISTNEVYQIPMMDTWQRVELSGKGFYFIEEGILYFMDYETKEKKLLSEGVTAYATDADKVYTADRLFRKNSISVPIDSFTNMYVSDTNVYVLEEKLYAFDKKTEQFKFALALPDASVFNSISYSETGIALVSARISHRSPQCIVFDESDGHILSSIDHAPEEEFVSHEKDAISKDGTWIASPDANQVRVINLENGNEFSIECEKYVYLVFFSEDGALLYTVTADGRFRVWATEGACKRIDSDGTFIDDGDNFYYILDNTFYRENAKTGKKTPIFTSEFVLHNLSVTNDFVIAYEENTKNEDITFTCHFYDKNTATLSKAPHSDDYFPLNEEENIVYAYGDEDGEFIYMDLDTMETFTPAPSENITHGNGPVLYTKTDDGMYRYDFKHGFHAEKIADASTLSSACEIINVSELKHPCYLLTDRYSSDAVRYFLVDSKKSTMTKITTNTTDYCYIAGICDDFSVLKSGNMLYELDYESGKVTPKTVQTDSEDSIIVSKDLSYLVYGKQNKIVVEDYKKGTVVAEIDYPENKTPASLEKHSAMYYTFDENGRILHIGYYDHVSQKYGVLLYDINAHEYIADYEGTLANPQKSLTCYQESTELIKKEKENYSGPDPLIRIYKNVYAIPFPISSGQDIDKKASDLLRFIQFTPNK